MKKLALLLFLSASVWAEPARQIHVTLADSVKHNMPALGFTLDATGTALESSLFPDKDRYLGMSGPPGGPLGVHVSPAKDLQGFVKSHYGSKKGFEMGKSSSLKFAGETRPTLAFIAGVGFTRTLNLAVFIAPKGSRPGAVVLFDASSPKGPAGDGLELLKHSSLAPVAKSFKLDP